MMCPHCLSRPTGRALTSPLLKWQNNSFRSPTKLVPGRLATVSRSAQEATTPGGRIPSRSYHSSEPLTFNEPATTLSSPAAEGVTATKPRARAKKASVVPAGVPLKGLSYLKNGSDPIAGADSEYPSWLWTCLDEQSKGKGKDGNDADEAAGDLYSKSKKERRQAAKRLRKLAASNPEQLVPKVPLIEQSIDLPSNPMHSVEGAMEASEARQDLTRALRAKRRASIKEKNYLKGMR